MTEKEALKILAKPLPVMTRAVAENPCLMYDTKVKPGLEAAKAILQFIPFYGPKIVGYILLAQGLIENLCSAISQRVK